MEHYKETDTESTFNGTCSHPKKIRGSSINTYCLQQFPYNSY